MHFITSFDFNSSILNRSIGSSSSNIDTPLGNIASQQLSLALAQNAAFNSNQTPNASLNINVNPFGIKWHGNI